jgi:hypothetical protein
MRYTVTWSDPATQELGAIWATAPDRKSVTEAAERIDRTLSSDPDLLGVEFYGDRLLVDLPLAVVFTVRADDRIVKVLQVWHR